MTVIGSRFYDKHFLLRFTMIFCCSSCSDSLVPILALLQALVCFSLVLLLFIFICTIISICFCISLFFSSLTSKLYSLLTSVTFSLEELHHHVCDSGYPFLTLIFTYCLSFFLSIESSFFFLILCVYCLYVYVILIFCLLFSWLFESSITFFILLLSFLLYIVIVPSSSILFFSYFMCLLPFLRHSYFCLLFLLFESSIAFFFFLLFSLFLHRHRSIFINHQRVISRITVRVSSY